MQPQVRPVRRRTLIWCAEIGPENPFTGWQDAANRDIPDSFQRPVVPSSELMLTTP
jgi:hypothetical protein